MANRTAIAVLTATGSGLFALMSLTHGDAQFAEVGVAATATGLVAWLSLDKPSKKTSRQVSGPHPASSRTCRFGDVKKNTFLIDFGVGYRAENPLVPADQASRKPSSRADAVRVSTAVAAPDLAA